MLTSPAETKQKKKTKKKGRKKERKRGPLDIKRREIAARPQELASFRHDCNGRSCLSTFNPVCISEK